jgi:hypothetical protein
MGTIIAESQPDKSNADQEVGQIRLKDDKTRKCQLGMVAPSRLLEGDRKIATDIACYRARPKGPDGSHPWLTDCESFGWILDSYFLLRAGFHAVSY